MSVAPAVPFPALREIVGDPCLARDVEVGDKICDCDGIVHLVVKISCYDDVLVFHAENKESLSAEEGVLLAVIKR